MSYGLHLKNVGIKPKFGKGNCCHCGNLIENILHLRHKNICRKCYNEQNRLYKHSGSRIEFQMEISKSNKNKIRRLIQHLIKYGIVEPLECQVCGKDISLAHHVDYHRPLLIEWLCYEHHTARHFGEKFDISPINYSKDADVIEYLDSRNSFKDLKYII